MGLLDGRAAVPIGAAQGLGPACTPDEVATVALFLACDLSSYLTGGVLEVTGGRYT